MLSGDLFTRPVPLVVNTAALVSARRLRSDGGDLRFLSSDGATPLDYWVESGMNTATTVVWVRYPAATKASQFSGANVSPIDLTYGDPTLTSTSAPLFPELALAS